MLAITVEQQVLADVIYGCISQKLGRNFSELVSSASALCGSAQLRVRLKSQNLHWKPLYSVTGRKGGLKPLGLVCRRGEKKLLCLMIFMQKISWRRDWVAYFLLCRSFMKKYLFQGFQLTTLCTQWFSVQTFACGRSLSMELLSRDTVQFLLSWQIVLFFCWDTLKTQRQVDEVGYLEQCVLFLIPDQWRKQQRLSNQAIHTSQRSKCPGGTVSPACS